MTQDLQTKAITGSRPNARRRAFHLLATLLIPVLSLVLPREALLPLVWSVVAVAFTAEAARFSYARLNALFLRYLGLVVRQKETSRTTGATYVALSTALCFTAFPYPVALAAICFLAVGDSCAGFVGERWGKTRLIGRKSLQGSIAFLAAALIAGVLVTLVAPLPLPLMAFGAVIAALVELLPFPFDDNITIPIAAGLAMSLLNSVVLHAVV